MSNVSVVILKSSENLELLIRGDSSIDRVAIENAFQDGLRKPNDILVEAAREISRTPRGSYILACKPFRSDNMERSCATIRYELQFYLNHPIKTSH